MLKFFGTEDATAAFHTAQQPYGYGGFTSRIRTTQWFMNTREWASKSRTAQELIKFVEDSDVVINFVGMEGGFQCFDESADNLATGQKEPTIYVDITGHLSLWVRGPHEQHLKRSAVRNPVMVSFDNRIATLHELGHAKQFIENPGWCRLHSRALLEGRDFKGRKVQLSLASLRNDIESGARAFWTAKLKPSVAATGGGASSSGGLPPPPPPMGGPVGGGGATGFLPRTTDHAASQNWFVVIDSDNIARHERPICTEMGLPLRLSYTDLSAG